MLPYNARRLFDILVVYVVGSLAATLVPSSSLPISQWNNLNKTVEGRLHVGTPLALGCFSLFDGKKVQVNKAACAQVQEEYRDSLFRSSQFSAYMEPQWETCQRTSQQCLLDSANPTDPLAFNKTTECSQGSIPPFYIDVRKASDIQAAFAFSASNKIPLVIKNSGHDYKGRSSGIGSLALWTHNMKTITHSQNFIPEGCSKAYNAITMGAGAEWQDVYNFADSIKVTIIGGYAQTIGASGGWLMGGGHSVLSPVYGLGVDRVVQFKVVTPDGKLRTANSCQNTDLFFALRGGGGGTFGVVLESTQMVEKQIALQVTNVQLSQTSNVTEFYKLVIDNSLGWGKSGWGGHLQGPGFLYVNPLLNLAQAKSSMKPVTDRVLAQNGTAIIETLPSWNAFFQKYVVDVEAGVGTPLTLGSRLVPVANFETEEGRSAILNVLVKLFPTGFPHIPVVAPLLYNATDGATSVTPAWRTALWHFAFHAQWEYNTSKEEIQAQYRSVTNTIQMIRDITPGSGAYQNECDLYEPDHETSFWGDNYPRLLEIKKKYDPLGLLQCWQCVGWEGSSNDRYRCYLPA